ncbi:MAG: cysteine desulfurase family protein [Bacteroidota bacterium]
MNTDTKIYLDHAASTPLDPAVFDVMRPYFLDFQGNPSSTHAYGRTLKHAMEQARRDIANCLNVRPLEIYFTSGGTESDNLAIKGAVEGYQLKHIISSPIEHHAVTHPIEELEREGKVTVTWLNVDRKGHISLQELERALKANPRSLVSLMHGNNEIGTVYDIVSIGQLCRQYDALFHSDTVQTLGKVPLDASELEVDFLTASGHKFYGPKGVGFLYVRKGISLPPLVTGGGQERSLRPGTENIPAIVGMATALKRAYERMETSGQQEWELKTYLVQQLKTYFPGVRFNGETEPEHCLPNVVNITLPGAGDPMLLFNLDLKGIAASGGSACSSGATVGSHVLHHIGVTQDEMPRSLRLSVGKTNQKSDVDILIQALQEIMVPANA